MQKFSPMNLIFKYASLLLLVVLMNACKQSSEKKNIENQEASQLSPEKANDNEPTNCSLTLRTLIKYDDSLQIYYIQENNKSYLAERIISKEVKGSDQFQDIIFYLPT